jgi:DNA-binding CsgD family transcriptional regulator/PAS domain-containing protein
MSRQTREPTDTGAADRLTVAIKSADLAVGLVDLSDGTIVSISQAWLDHLRLPADAVIGQPATDLIRSDKDAAAQVLASLRDGAISAYVARRELNTPLDGDPITTVWVRSFELGGRHLAFVQAAAAIDGTVSPLTKHFARTSGPMAIGTIDGGFTITALSTDITDLLGLSPLDLVGKLLLSVVARQEVTPLLTASDETSERAVGLTIHLRDKEGRWVKLCCVLTSLTGNPDRCFILVPEPEADVSSSRVAELEHHLWSIAAIVDASGVLRRVGPMKDMTSLPQANNLTTRQWEVLARIVRGERAPTIASDLHVSPSTVRNHLSAIFKRFGVHSQPELLRMIDALPDATSA